jgi:hypothetical protein
MSNRSKRKHRQQMGEQLVPRRKPAAAPARSSQGGTKRRAIWLAAAVVVVAAVVYAVSGGGGRKGETASASVTNLASSTTPLTLSPLLAATTGVASVASSSGPKIVFATPVYDFGQIKGGEAVKYTFVFTNAGDRLLEVSGVQPACGCTTAGEWTRQVEPNQTGSIPIQFNSGGFGGNVGKTITVTCNDPNQPAVTLQIKGNIWKAIDVTPPYAMFNLHTEAPSDTKPVRIVSNEETPLTLSAPESSNPAFVAELTTNQPGKEFQLMVKTVPPLAAGTVQGQITLKTSSTNMPVINVTAYAIVQPALTVAPAQITLQAIQLGNPTPATVSIRYIGTNVLALSEAAVNAKGVEVDLKEVQPGRDFTLAVSFPAGFEMAPGEKVELSVKSNHPQFPMIKVPVIQPPRPASLFDPLGTPAVPPTSSQ